MGTRRSARRSPSGRGLLAHRLRLALLRATSRSPRPIPHRHRRRRNPLPAPPIHAPRRGPVARDARLAGQYRRIHRRRGRIGGPERSGRTGLPRRGPVTAGLRIQRQARRRRMGNRKDRGRMGRTHAPARLSRIHRPRRRLGRQRHHGSRRPIPGTRARHPHDLRASPARSDHGRTDGGRARLGRTDPRLLAPSRGLRETTGHRAADHRVLAGRLTGRPARLAPRQIRGMERHRGQPRSRRSPETESSTTSPCTG